ncbi:DUF6343 family protein [Streptomyces sp. NPDC051776]|uniref:DUF6343 family protein n=1 Tax=Streptomyces sp. NPDC051776 TaxID=3155414 RepID=UPI00344420AD
MRDDSHETGRAAPENPYDGPGVPAVAGDPDAPAFPEDPGAPVPRSRSGIRGRGHPRTGTEPVTARSALGLRKLLAVIYTPVFLAGAVLFAIWASRSHAGSSPSSGALGAIAIVCAVLSLLALTDLMVVEHRLKRERARRSR